MVTLTVTVTFSYEADPVHYDTDDAAKMAAIDQRNFDEDPGSLWEVLQDVEYEVKVTPFTPPKEEED